MIQLPQLQESLLLANDRLVARSRRRAQRFPLGLMTSAAVVSIGGAAAAGIALWDPVLGHEDGNRPTASQTPVPHDQAALLGVLARDQAATDRGPVARAALVAASRRYVGVRITAVRVPFHPSATTGIALVPVAHLRARPGVSPGPATDSLCLYTQEREPGFDIRCVSTEDVGHGRATGVVGDRAFGLVPDGVARVAVTAADGARMEVPVSGNLFVVPLRDATGTSSVVGWLAANGSPVEPEGGTPMTLPRVPKAKSAPEGFHDCGAAEGGIVPGDVVCGADSRRWGAEHAPKPLDARP